jgi:hypothetical protein
MAAPTPSTQRAPPQADACFRLPLRSLACHWPHAAAGHAVLRSSDRARPILADKVVGGWRFSCGSMRAGGEDDDGDDDEEMEGEQSTSVRGNTWRRDGLVARSRWEREGRGRRGLMEAGHGWGERTGGMGGIDGRCRPARSRRCSA